MTDFESDLDMIWRLRRERNAARLSRDVLLARIEELEVALAAFLTVANMRWDIPSLDPVDEWDKALLQAREILGAADSEVLK
jgi:hypothetical protein